MIRPAALFRTLWRVNAIVVLAAALLVCAAAVVVMVTAIRQSARELTSQDSATHGPEAMKGEVFELGSMGRLRGTPTLLLELISHRRHSASQDAHSVRNLLFYDSETGKSTWLFTQYGLLAGIRPLAERGDDKARIRWILLEQVSQDTNHDGRLTLEDAHTLGVVDADGQNYKDLMANVERVLGVEFLSDTVVDVAVSAADADYIFEIDLPRREVRRRTLLRYHRPRD